MSFDTDNQFKLIVKGTWAAAWQSVHRTYASRYSLHEYLRKMEFVRLGVPVPFQKAL